MTEVERRVRARIYERLMATGSVPALPRLADGLELPLEEARSAVRGLAERHLLALVPGTDEVWMAHPFSGVPTAFLVRAGEKTYWANCAWDSLAIPAVLGSDADVVSSCGDCGDVILVEVRRGSVSHDGAVVHMLVPPRRFWDDIGYT